MVQVSSCRLEECVDEMAVGAAELVAVQAEFCHSQEELAAAEARLGEVQLECERSEGRLRAVAREERARSKAQEQSKGVLTQLMRSHSELREQLTAEISRAAGLQERLGTAGELGTLCALGTHVSDPLESVDSRRPSAESVQQLWSAGERE